MNVTLGNATIALSLVSCLAGVVISILGVRRHDAALSVWIRPLATMSLVGVVASVGLMQVALLTNDTTVRYVYDHGSSATPFPFNVATMEGADSIFAAARTEPSSASATTTRSAPRSATT